MSPLISVIVTAFDGSAALDRALRSVALQSFADWEAVVVDCGANRETSRVIGDWAKRDRSFRVVSSTALADGTGSVPDTFRGDAVSGARNAALRGARGSVVTYLDVGCAGHDDEYYANFLQQVARHYDKADMLFFGYDILHADGPAAGKVLPWDPAQVGHAIFAMKPAAPLGVCHRRALWERLGGFNERLWAGEDWDLWKRAARAGAEAVFLPVKSGRMHVSARNAACAARPTDWQREAALANWEAGRPLFEGAAFRGMGFQPMSANITGRMPVPREEQMDGTLECEGLPSLCKTGGSPLDVDLTEKRRQASAVQRAAARVFAADFAATSAGGGTGGLEADDGESGGGADGTRSVPANVLALPVPPRSTLHTSPSKPAAKRIAYIAPHCLIDPTSGAAVATVQAMLFLQTLGFQCSAFCGARLDLPEEVTAMLDRHKVPYRQGAIAAQGGQVAVVEARIEGFGSGGSMASGTRSVPDTFSLEVTIVANEFARQAEFYRACAAYLDAQRPDVVITYGGDPLAGMLTQLTKMRDIPLLFWLHNFAYYATHPFVPADYVIVPSEFNRRYIPARYTPQTRDVPTAEEVEPWVEKIIRLWDDPAEYERYSQAARERAQLWHPDRLAPIYRDFFGGIRHQPGPPLAPQCR